MVTPAPATIIKRGQFIAKLTKARKHYRDTVTQEYIYPDEEYYSITVVNSGLRGRVFPDRVRPENLGLYFIRRGV